MIIYLLSTAYEMVPPELSVLMASAELDKRQALNRPPWRALEARNLKIPKFVFATRIFFAIFTLFIVEGDNAPRTRKGSSSGRPEIRDRIPIPDLCPEKRQQFRTPGRKLYLHASLKVLHECLRLAFLFAPPLMGGKR